MCGGGVDSNQVEAEDECRVLRFLWIGDIPHAISGIFDSFSNFNLNQGYVVGEQM
jgi:hypothetical protein